MDDAFYHNFSHLQSICNSSKSFWSKVKFILRLTLLWRWIFPEDDENPLIGTTTKSTFICIGQNCGVVVIQLLWVLLGSRLCSLYDRPAYAFLTSLLCAGFVIFT